MNARLYHPSNEAELVRLAAASMPGWVRLRYDYASGYAMGLGMTKKDLNFGKK